MSLKWSETSTGLIGEFPCGLSIVITRRPDFWTVRFGTSELDQVFKDPEEAKRIGQLFAKEKIIECLSLLPEGFDSGTF